MLAIMMGNLDLAPRRIAAGRQDVGRFIDNATEGRSAARHGADDGRELAEEAKRRWPEIKLLYTTGYTRNAIVHGGRLDAGVNLLPKPYTTEELSPSGAVGARRLTRRRSSTSRSRPGAKLSSRGTLPPLPVEPLAELH